MIGFCKCCKKFRLSIKKRRRNTAYVNEESNWLTACKECQQEDDEYNRERWAEYYSGLM